MFKQSCGGDLDELADVTCSCAAFCKDMIMPCKQVKTHPNNKPEVNNSVKSCIQKKKADFSAGSSLWFAYSFQGTESSILKAKQNYKT